METCINYTDGTAFMSSDERKWINRLRRLAEQCPDEVVILRQPEDNDGCIYARLPASFVKIQPKKHRELSDEERVILVERMRYLAKKQQ